MDSNSIEITSVRKTIRSEAVVARQWYFYNRMNQNQQTNILLGHRVCPSGLRTLFSVTVFLQILTSIIELCNNLICALDCITNGINQKLYFLTLYNIGLSRTGCTETSNRHFECSPLVIYPLPPSHVELSYIHQVFLYVKNKRNPSYYFGF